MDGPAGRREDIAVGVTERVALVVGGSRGIGRSIAERLAHDGYKIAVAGLSQAEIDATVATITGRGATAIGSRCDVREPDLTKQTIQTVLDTYGRLDILLNSAGISYIAPVLLGKPDKWREVLETNLTGAFIISRAVLRPMIKARWGRIVHVGSISSQIGAPHNAIYAASKAGIDALVRSLALEVAPTGITVNAVAPGYVKTDLFQYTQGRRAEVKGVTLEEHEADLRAEIPTNRLIAPEDIASAVAFLVSDEARSITGQILNVDGGRTAI